MPFHLADAIFWIAVACCTIAQSAILRSILITPLSAGDRRTSSRRRVLEAVWAIVPGIALIVVLVLTWRAMHGEPAKGQVAAASVASRAS